MQFPIISSTVIPDGKPVDNRNLLLRFRDWLANRESIPMYRIQRALFHTHGDYKPPVGATITLENGTSWLVTHRRSFGFYADCKTLLQKTDIESSHDYRGRAVEIQYACPDNQEELIINNRNPHV